MALAEFDVQLGAVGRGRVIVNGEDLSDRCSGLQVTSIPGEPTRLMIEMYGEGHIKGEGVVEVSRDLDQRQVVVEFLENLNAGSLESAALEKMDGLGGMSTGEAFLEALKEMVRGDNDGT